MPITAVTPRLLQQIKLLILDVDGVLTDGKLYICDHSTEFKAFHAHDGLGMKNLQTHTDVQIAVISGRRSAAASHRLTELNVQHQYLGYENKLPIYQQLLSQLQLKPEQIAYVGDDLPDWDIMQHIGMSIAVNNAVPFLQQKADYVTTRKGGEGAVREVCDLLLEAKLGLTNHSNTKTQEA